MIIHDDVKLDYSDVMLLPQCNPEGPKSRGDVTLRNNGVIPIIAANMDGVGTFEMAKELAMYGVMTALHKHYDYQELVEFFGPLTNNHVIYSMGANDADYSKFVHFHAAYTQKWKREGGSGMKLPTICIDVANGYTQAVADFITDIKRYDVKVIAGNVVTEEGVFHLANAGADIIKVGIGPGSVCTTRRLTGIGFPQFSAVLECVQAADTFGHYGNRNPGNRPSPKIIADGGITSPGDIAKALAAGADYVMLGGMLAGHNEGGGHLHVEEFSKKRSRYFYGMASKDAQNKHNGGVAEYRASEGKGVWIEDKGPVKNTIQEILGGLRSSCAYQGVKNLADISKNPKFIRVNHQLNNVFGA